MLLGVLLANTIPSYQSRLHYFTFYVRKLPISHMFRYMKDEGAGGVGVSS